MPLSVEQQTKAQDALSKVMSSDRHSVENGLGALDAIGADVKPYLAYLMRSGSRYEAAILRYMDTKRDAWAARLLYEVLENHSSERRAQAAWNSLKTMGKLPKEWREPKFTTALWEKCRTQPPEMPAQTDAAWRPVVKWNLLFKLLDDDKAVRDETLDEFAYIGAAATPGLVAALEEDDPDLMKPALVMLKRVGDARALPALQGLVEHENTAIRALANGAIKAVERRPAPVEAAPAERPAVPTPETLAEREAFSQEIASPTLVGGFDPALERRVVRALMRAAAPDPDEKRAGWQEFERMGADALPILRHYAEDESGRKAQQAASVIKALYSG